MIQSFVTCFQFPPFLFIFTFTNLPSPIKPFFSSNLFPIFYYILSTTSFPPSTPIRPYHILSSFPSLIYTSLSHSLRRFLFRAFKFNNLPFYVSSFAHQAPSPTLSPAFVPPLHRSASRRVAPLARVNLAAQGIFSAGNCSDVSCTARGFVARPRLPLRAAAAHLVSEGED
ncbi:hypothetical protein R5R35_000382 [Gryllus longicercus]|uniref:Uncharacterized protein n=1 Tax=Gryllus longicercus TaxID=2509291 RepID=A0AAN9YXG7_9ORTH